MWYKINDSIVLEKPVEEKEAEILWDACQEFYCNVTLMRYKDERCITTNTSAIFHLHPDDIATINRNVSGELVITKEADVFYADKAMFTFMLPEISDKVIKELQND